MRRQWSDSISKHYMCFSLLTGEGEECEANMQVVGQFFKEKGWGVAGQDGLGE